MSIQLRLLFPAILAAAAACDRSGTEPTNNGDLAAADEAVANDATAAAPAQEFVTNAAASDMYEIEAGKLASEKASDPAIREFGQMLVTDHTKSSNDMKAAASQVDPSLAPPAALPADKQAKIDELKAASDADFDRLFLTQQVEAHSAALQLLQSYAARGEAAPLKAFAEKTAPVVQSHLAKVQSFQE